MNMEQRRTSETRPEAAGLPSDWSEVLSDELYEPYWSKLMAFVDAARADHAVYPPADQVFKAFELSAYDATRVVILGQDPYHGPGQAHGLCFSVPDGLPKKPPSLVNILKELKADVGVDLPSGSLEGWARQGVLLLNTTLTVRDGKAGSHRRRGWETFTNAVISALDEKDRRVVFILWGKDARRKKKLIMNPSHKVIESAHPSPLSAYRGFVGSRPFSSTNALLNEVGLPPIDWSNANRAKWNRRTGSPYVDGSPQGQVSDRRRPSGACGQGDAGTRRVPLVQAIISRRVLPPRS